MYAKPQQQKDIKNPIQKKSAPNLTGIPNAMKTSYEISSGISFDNVRVHYNSDKPAQLQALAYTQGNQVYIAPGQEKHLSHELGHIVQQKQGIVKPTTSINGYLVNSDPSMEQAADTMWRNANEDSQEKHNLKRIVNVNSNNPFQLKTHIFCETQNYDYMGLFGSQSEKVGKHMEAYIDQKDPKQGSAPSPTALCGIMADLQSREYQHMIKGHLMNGNLGGPGISENLFPITSKANHMHLLYVENVVKKTLANKQFDPNVHGIFYSVEVTEADYTTSSPGGKFTCEAYAWTNKNIVDHSAVNTKNPIFPPMDIVSKPIAKSTGDALVEPLSFGMNIKGEKIKKTVKDPEKVSFATSDLPLGWGEKGKGAVKNRKWDYVILD